MSLNENFDVDFNKYPAIVSFPRSGSNFFIRKFRCKTGVELKMTHRMLRQKNLISFIREPESSLASFLTMKLEADIFFNNLNDKPGLDYLLKKLEEMSEQYLKFYNYLAQSNNFIVEYNNLLNKTEDYIKNAALYLNIKLLENPEDPFALESNISSGYLWSSKISNHYDYCLDIVKKIDTTQLKLAYNIVLSKSIIL